MKKFSKILSVALLVALVLSLGVANAFAEDQTPPASIKITHDASYEGATGTTARVYNAYKVFDAAYPDGFDGENTQTNKDSFNYPEGAAVSYTMPANSPWKAAIVDADATTQKWVTAELSSAGDVYIITATDKLVSADDALAFATYLKGNIPSGVTPTEVTVDAANATRVFPGYYLIVAKDSKDGVTRLSLVTTDVTMVEKNTYITTEKTTAETSYEIGDTVTYFATVTIPSDTALTVADSSTATGYKAGHGPIILHDSMDSKLTFTGVSGATIKDIGAQGDGEAFANTESVTKYSVADSSLGDNCTFEITIPVTEDIRGKAITFTYTAEVNDTAATDTGFVNDLFGELNGYKTNPDDVYVYTFDFSLKKEFKGATGNDANFKATFELRRTADGTAVSLVQIDSTRYALLDSDDDDQTVANPKTIVTSFEVQNNQTINIKGVKAGMYYLVETNTATGYNKLTDPVEVKITDLTFTDDGSKDPANPSHKVEYKIGTETFTEATDKVITVENNSGTVLPSTGGIGTTIFYVVGGVLVLAAIILLVTKKRMSE